MVTDVSAIPDEPPDDILYHHKVRMSDSVKILWDHREIVYTLAERDFRAQYKQATLGILWAVLSPVATLVIFVIVFSRVKSFPHPGHPVRPLRLRRHPVLELLRLGRWVSGGNSLLANKALLAKTQFPRECFPLETMLATALNTVLSWVPLAILFVIFGRAPKLATLWVPLFMMIEVAFAAGVTLALASLIIQMRDLAQVFPSCFARHLRDPGDLALLLRPHHFHVAGGHLIHGHWVGGFSINLQIVYGFFNPLGPVISNLRATMLLGHNPSWGPLIAAVCGCAMYLAIGFRIFKRFEVNFADIA